MFKSIAIVAPGLLGASLAIAISEKGLAQNVAIWARRQAAVDALKSQSWCQKASVDLEEACQDAELIVLCSPVNSIISLSQQIATIAQNSPIVTDVGSVKDEIVRECQTALVGKARFIGSHPMAGSEKTGMENACSTLFDGKTCFVTPTDDSDPEALEKTIAFWKAVGSQVVVENPQKHDEIVAQVSHLPHVIATSLSTFLASRCPAAADYCGNGLRDTTRVASGSPALWQEIIAQNRTEVLKAIADFQTHLKKLYHQIEEKTDSKLFQELSLGKEFRDQL
ncbi:prephenate dehydrogenase/arogenate dehydrogenase family protein [Pelagicoccus albus]|uniref:Prephenate dehydrogenase/arogenate dehydrogenase family protein n=1 Tax=Pelagicoccus albus TaxID=415222 RepID=A0A7X1B3E1_9BACT|nr:prephenate dehydrogenase/arogenate dehydrogenase family protein [Pelagicoccus albus]